MCMTIPDSKHFIFSRCASKKEAIEIGVGNPPELLFFDPDGEKLFSTGVNDLSGVESAMQKALEMYGPKAISWTDYDDAAVAAAGQCVLVVFTNDKADSETLLKNLEDRAVAKFHARLGGFYRKEAAKDSPEMKKYGVASAPAIVLVDPSREGGKQVIDKFSGKGTPSSLRAFLAKAEKK